MSNCSKITDNEIIAYVNGEFDEDRMSTFESHYTYCPDCRARVGKWVAATQVIAEKGDEILKKALPVEVLRDRQNRKRRIPDYVSRLKDWPTGLAAANYAFAAVLLLLMIAVPATSFIAYRDYRVIEKYGANFQTHADWETILAAPSRSSRVAVEYPPNGARLGDDVRFRWEKVPATPELTLAIFNNRAGKVFSVQTAETEVKLKSELEPGLYYWSLRAGETNLHLGKFYVDRPILLNP